MCPFCLSVNLLIFEEFAKTVPNNVCQLIDEKKLTNKSFLAVFVGFVSQPAVDKRVKNLG
jgi:hypothetical protein